MNKRKIETILPINADRTLPPAALAQMARAIKDSGVVDHFQVWDQMMGWWPPGMWNTKNAPLAAMVPDLDARRFCRRTRLRHFRDDKGRSWVEKGLDNLNISAPRKKLMSFLAIYAFFQTYMMVGYQLPFNLITMQADTSPALPSYLTNGICGEGSNYACPSKQYVSLPFRNGENYVRPDDPRLPPEIRELNRTGMAYGWFNNQP